MKAAYYERFSGPVSIASVPDPVLESGGVILKVLATGLCLSDWHGWKGHDSDIRLPHVPGHEIVGEIVEISKDIQGWRIGDRVTLPFVCGCGNCPTCTNDAPQVCPQQFQPGFTHWGSFAEYVSIHFADYNLVSLPESISSVTAASLGCRFATSFRGIVEQGKLQSEEVVAIFGCGGVGLSAVMIACAKGAQVIAIDTKQSALDKAKEIGAHHCILSSNSTLTAEHVNSISRGGADLTVDAIGHQEVIQIALASLKRHGRHVQIGLVSPGSAIDSVVFSKVIANELTIIGSHGMAASHYPEMIQMIEQGLLRPNLLVDQAITLEEAVIELPFLDQYKGSGIRVINEF